MILYQVLRRDVPFYLPFVRIFSIGTRSEFTEEEKEAVSLLNKFVGGSVSLHELEVIPSLNERVVFSKKTASLDKKSENQVDLST